MLWRVCLLLVLTTVALRAFPDSVQSRLFIGHSIYSDESPARFLGTISASTSGDSILNASGSYGSGFSSTSIRNRNSSYGSSFSSVSAYNPSASRPPLIVNSQNVIVGYITKNTAKSPRIDPDLLVYRLTALNNWSFYSGLFYRELYAYNGTFLGVTSPDKNSPLSIINEFGSYGSSFSSTSIFNRFGTYGSEFSGQSAYNSFASTPPALLTPQQLGGRVAAYVTKNTFRSPSADPDVLRAALLLAPDMPWLAASSYLLEGFTTSVGAASRAQTISISASNLITSVKVSLLPLEKYWEISVNGSSFGSEFDLQPVNGRVNATVQLRLSASAPSTANEPGGRNFSGFTVTTAYAGTSIYMSGTVASLRAPVVTVDRTRPILNVTSPRGIRATTKARQFTLRGTARDNVSPTQIQFRLKPPRARGYSRWTTINLSRGNAKTKGWKRPISLGRKGQWAVQIRVLDAQKNASATRTLRITRK